MSVPVPYILTNAHFVISSLSFFAFFAAAWLYVDSWRAVRKEHVLLGKSLGFFVLACAAGLDGAISTSGISLPVWLVAINTIGLLILVLSFFAEFLPGKPEGLVTKAIALPLLGISLFGFNVLLAVALAGRMWQQATTYLERSRKVMAIALGLLAGAWMMHGLLALPATQTGQWSLLGEPFGFAWITAHALEAIGAMFLTAWAWNFMRFRLLPQLYLTVVGATLVIFVTTTLLFTVVLFNRTEAQTVDVLQTNARVFGFTLEELQQQLFLSLALLGSRDSLVTAVAEQDEAATREALGNPIQDFKVSSILVLNQGGEVFYAVGQPYKKGQSLTGNALVQEVFTGKAPVTALVEQGPEFPTIFMRAGRPLVQDGRVVGALFVDFPVDTPFLDRVKDLTGLEVSLYGGQELAATTLRDHQGRPRQSREVLPLGEAFHGSFNLGYEPFLVAAIPLENHVEQVIGTLVVGVPQATLLASLQKAVQATLLGAVILMGFSLIPLYFIARVMSRYQSA